MELYKIINSNNQKVLAEEARTADNFFTRLRGLLFTNSLKKGQGLLIVPCQSIHSIGMAYPIDAIFLNKKYTVVGLVPNFKPWQMSSIFWQAHSCLELPLNTISQSNTTIGDILILKESGKPEEN